MLPSEPHKYRIACAERAILTENRDKEASRGAQFAARPHVDQSRRDGSPVKAQPRARRWASGSPPWGMQRSENPASVSWAIMHLTIPHLIALKAG